MAVTLLRIVLPVLLFALCQVAESAKMEIITFRELLGQVKECETTYFKKVVGKSPTLFTTTKPFADTFAGIEASQYFSGVLDTKRIKVESSDPPSAPPVYVVPVRLTEEESHVVGGEEHTVAVEGGEEHTVAVEGGKEHAEKQDSAEEKDNSMAEKTVGPKAEKTVGGEKDDTMPETIVGAEAEKTVGPKYGLMFEEDFEVDPLKNALFELTNCLAQDSPIDNGGYIKLRYQIEMVHVTVVIQHLSPKISAMAKWEEEGGEISAMAKWKEEGGD
eukprot:GHVS01038391.1.p1 GENE.GHVS01038391.1~~GHVS01038391.1.p1  ORF type:complete len:285 (+),score=59.80 GHVS01038391.1:34-855(+)